MSVSERIDLPSQKGKFGYREISKAVIPFILRSDNEMYVSVRIVETKVLNRYLQYLSKDIVSCRSVKSFHMTEVEGKLLNEINRKHCEAEYGTIDFTDKGQHVVPLSELLEFHAFIETCYNKLLLRVCMPTDRCGFVRINQDSVVPYTVKDNLKLVPLFYFEGETDTLKLKGMKLVEWDLAYLKFCCKVQGIKSELFDNDYCLVTPLEDIKAYFPENTTFEDYWPTRTQDLQVTKKESNGGTYSWVHKPQPDLEETSATVLPSAAPAQISPTAKHSNPNQNILKLTTVSPMNSPQGTLHNLSLMNNVQQRSLPNGMVSTTAAYPMNGWPATPNFQQNYTSQLSAQRPIQPRASPSQQQQITPTRPPQAHMNRNVSTTPPQRTYANAKHKTPSSPHYAQVTANQMMNLPNTTMPNSLVSSSIQNSLIANGSYSNANSYYTGAMMQSAASNANLQSMQQMVQQQYRHAHQAASMSYQQQQQPPPPPPYMVSSNTVTKSPMQSTSVGGTTNNTALRHMLNGPTQSTNGRYPPPLTPITTVMYNSVQSAVPPANTVAYSKSNSTSSAGNKQAVLSSQIQQKQTPPSSQAQQNGSMLSYCSDVIDLSSPPSSPSLHQMQQQHHITNGGNGTQCYGSNGIADDYSGWDLIKIAEPDPRLSKPAGPMYSMQKILVKDKYVPVINSTPFSFTNNVLMTVSDLKNNFFPLVPLSQIRDVLLTVLHANLYAGNSLQMKVLKDNNKCKAVTDTVPLIDVKDVEVFYPHLCYTLQREDPDLLGSQPCKRPRIS